MDLEFALTLQNMENEPPQPQFGSHHDNETLFSFTQRVHTHRRARAELNFFHGNDSVLLLMLILSKCVFVSFNLILNE